MTLPTWLAFCALELVLCLSPGPAVLLVVTTALRAGLRPALRAMLGIVLGNLSYFALSATGIAALILASSQVFLWLKWAGALYLVWLGGALLFRRGAPVPQPGGADTVPARNGLRDGFIVQVSNPKALVFFIALLPQFIDASASVAAQVLLLAGTSQSIEIVVLTLYAGVATRARALAGVNARYWVERLGGAMLVLIGVRLAWQSLATTS